MAQKERALIVSASAKSAEQLAEFVQASRNMQASTAGDAATARQMAADPEVSVVIVNAPLPDEDAIQLSAELAEQHLAGLLLLVKGAVADEVSSRVERHGVFVVDKPVQKTPFLRALGVASACAVRLRGHRKENARLRDKLSELQLVDRAKCALIQYLRFTEAQAHRFIEKQAMDRRITRGEVALGILRAYEE